MAQAAKRKTAKKPTAKKPSAKKPSAKKASAKPMRSVNAMVFARVYPMYVAKAERKGRTKAELDTIIEWLTGYDADGLQAVLASETDFEHFFAEAPAMNPARSAIKGVVCGVRVEDIEDPTMRDVRYLDKLVDELAAGKAMEKILRRV